MGIIQNTICKCMWSKGFLGIFLHRMWWLHELKPMWVLVGCVKRVKGGRKKRVISNRLVFFMGFSPFALLEKASALSISTNVRHIARLLF